MAAGAMEEACGMTGWVGIGDTARVAGWWDEDEGEGGGGRGGLYKDRMYYNEPEQFIFLTCGGYRMAC